MAPAFWYGKPGFLATLLTPLGWVYGRVGHILRSFTIPKKYSIPIISVGNIISGGSGKTPTAIALCQLLQSKNHKVHFVTRGYGGNALGPLLVNPEVHTFLEVGDEPLLLAHHAPTWVAKDRPLGVEEAIENGAEIIILDDGHQTHSLHKDISFVVVDQHQGFGNGKVIPAGPLRESIEEGLKRSSAIIAIGEENQRFSEETFQAFIKTQPLKISKAIAFCGLGFPQKFYNSLKEKEVELIETHSFPDHHPYRESNLETLYKLKEPLVTTRKDWVKLPKDWQMKVHVLDMEIQFVDPDELYKFILKGIGNGSADNSHDSLCMSYNKR
jgi:tetraacyldisaccharide 4'-kinase